MKVLITAVAFSSGISGVQRHAFNLVRCLLRLPDVASVHLAIAPWQREALETAGIAASGRLEIHIAPITAGSIARNVWHYRVLPKLVRAVQPSLVHLSFPVLVDPASFNCPTVMTLHDLYPLEIPRNFGYPQVLVNRMILRHSLQRVSAIACVSKTTLKRLSTYLPPSIVDKAFVIKNCVEPGVECSLQSPLPDWHGEPFLLCVAQHRLNKNISLAMGAFQRMLSAEQLPSDSRLVIIGIRGPESARLERQVRESNLGDNVMFLHGLSEAELQWCYARCEALLAPSYTEGFGLPVAEAMLAGCRVICSDIEAFREIGRDVCHYASLEGDAITNFAQAINKALSLPAPDPVKLPELSSSTLAERYGLLYRELLADGATDDASEHMPPAAALPSGGAVSYDRERQAL